MIAVTQDVFGEEGNCLAACIASIFELPLREVPNFAAGNNRTGAWFERLWAFCRARGFEVIPWYPSQGVLDWEALPEHLAGSYEYHVVSGPAPRGFSHATVGWRGEVIHDPHPTRAGLLATDGYYFLKRVEEKAADS